MTSFPLESDSDLSWAASPTATHVQLHWVDGFGCPVGWGRWGRASHGSQDWALGFSEVLVLPWQLELFLLHAETSQRLSSSDHAISKTTDLQNQDQLGGVRRTHMKAIYSTGLLFALNSVRGSTFHNSFLFVRLELHRLHDDATISAGGLWVAGSFTLSDRV